MVYLNIRATRNAVQRSEQVRIVNFIRLGIIHLHPIRTELKMHKIAVRVSVVESTNAEFFIRIARFSAWLAASPQQRRNAPTFVLLKYARPKRIIRPVQPI